VADLVRDVFLVARERVGLSETGPPLSTAAFRRPGLQRGLFD
jgi:hypothetical protein